DRAPERVEALRGGDEVGGVVAVGQRGRGQGQVVGEQVERAQGGGAAAAVVVVGDGHPAARPGQVGDRRGLGGGEGAAARGHADVPARLAIQVGEVERDDVEG